MAFDDKGWPVFPTRTGEAIGAALENRMLGTVGGAGGIRTRIQTLPDGSTVMLRTRNGFPEFTRTKVATAVAESFPRGLVDTDPSVLTGGKLNIVMSPKHSIPDEGWIKSLLMSKPATMFTGLLRKVVQVEFSRMTSPAVRDASVVFNTLSFGYSCSHGLTLHPPTGARWLIEISAAGIFRRPVSFEKPIGAGGTTATDANAANKQWRMTSIGEATKIGETDVYADGLVTAWDHYGWAFSYDGSQAAATCFFCEQYLLYSKTVTLTFSFDGTGVPTGVTSSETSPVIISATFGNTDYAINSATEYADQAHPSGGSVAYGAPLIVPRSVWGESAQGGLNLTPGNTSGTISAEYGKGPIHSYFTEGGELFTIYAVFYSDSETPDPDIYYGATEDVFTTGYKDWTNQYANKAVESVATNRYHPTPCVTFECEGVPSRKPAAMYSGYNLIVGGEAEYSGTQTGLARRTVYVNRSVVFPPELGGGTGSSNEWVWCYSSFVKTTTWWPWTMQYAMNSTQLVLSSIDRESAVIIQHSVSVENRNLIDFPIQSRGSTYDHNIGDVYEDPELTIPVVGTKVAENGVTTTTTIVNTGALVQGMPWVSYTPLIPTNESGPYTLAYAPDSAPDEETVTTRGQSDVFYIVGNTVKTDVMGTEKTPIKLDVTAKIGSSAFSSGSRFFAGVALHDPSPNLEVTNYGVSGYEVTEFPLSGYLGVF